MKAPRLKSMFRNVRTEPRRFEFRSRHLPELDRRWLERKQKLEEEFMGADSDQKRSIRIRRSGPSNATDRISLKKDRIRASRIAMIRASVIAVGLIWLAYKGILWVEQSDFSGVLEWMEHA